MSAIVGYIITTIRSDSHLTLRDFSEITEFQHTSLSKLERGETSISLDFMCKFSSLCNKNPSDFLLLIEDVADELLRKRNISIVETSDFLKIREIIKNGGTNPFIINGIFIDQNNPDILKNEINEDIIKKNVKPIFSNDLGKNISPELHKKMQNFPINKLNKQDILRSVQTTSLMSVIPLVGGIITIASMVNAANTWRKIDRNNALQSIGSSFLLRKKK